ncbi:sensor histidine kinase [Sphingobacterium pedocola]|uniref:histidine kinase n=1 Tax=Sphingobacterium pedocola TaxID=2082722 RepID=A0ABR9TAG7_9SPHI|nr:HAMP domain-containing sensor histidine kinase [Sphingobacterium pedocola]MBE8722323.1 hypothetical protein [Sphingobacterium pedocola]
MQLNAKHIRIITIAILFAILTGQAMWIYNVYETQYRLITQVKDEVLQTAILREHAYRHEKMGGTIVYNPLTHQNDTSRYITKTVQLKDTTFSVTHDRQDPYSSIKLNQFIFKDHLPVNVIMLDSIYRLELSNRGVPKANTYIEYIDLKNDKVLQRSKEGESAVDYTVSKLIVIDIFNTLGIKGYIQISTSAIVGTMIFQLILTALLIILCIFFLSMIIRTFFWREKMEEMRQDSVSAMTHEFKRPISSAVAQVSLIPYYLQKGDMAKVQQYADHTLLELNKLTSYTERIQKLSNNSKETISLNKESISLSDFFETTVKRYQNIQEKGTEITLSIKSDRKYLEADLIHFSNIIDNLIENAIKYSNEKVHIQITVTDAQDRLKISVKDDGLGILDSDQPHIFGKFYRSNNREIQRRVGFGLGLTYVKALVEAHDGEIKVESKFGTGSEFILYFP